MRKFFYKFLVVVLAFGMLTPAWLTKIIAPTKAEAAATAVTAGPNTGSNFSNDNSVGSYDWSNPNWAQISNDQWAAADITSSSNRTHYLKSTGFGFSIPAGVTINGISLSIEKHQSCDSGSCSSNINDDTVKLVKSGSVVGSNLAKSTDWSDTDVVTTYGGSTNLWGTTWTSADINNANFGSVISAERSSGGSRTAHIDQITLTVHYTIPDTSAPVIAAHPDVTVQATSVAGAQVNYTPPLATDVDDSTSSADCTPFPNSLFPIGSTEVICNKTDGAGNHATPTTFNIIVEDTTAPAVSLTSPIGGETFTQGETIDITWTATDNTLIPANNVNIFYSTDGGATYPNSNIIVLGTANDGSYHWTAPDIDSNKVRVKVEMADLYGNLGSDQSDTNFTIGNPDLTAPNAPVVAFFSPTNQLTQVVTGTAEIGAKIFVNSVHISDVASNGTFSATLSLLANSENTFSFTAKDAAGNESTPTLVNITQDSIAPATPNFNIENTGSGIRINWDNVGDAAYYEVWRASSPYALLAKISAPATTFLDTTVQAGHTYTYKIIARDLAGNASGFFEKNITLASAVTTSTSPRVATGPATPGATTPSVTAPSTNTPAPAEQGQIKGTDTTSDQTTTEKINWTPWIILFILIILAGAATGGYFYWFGRDEEEEIVSKEVITKGKKPAAKKVESAAKKSKRW